MAGTKIRIICLISFISLTFRRKSMPEAALNDVGPVTFCSTKPGVIPWSYDDADNIDLVIWTKGTTQVMYNTTGILQINDPKFELDTNTNAGLKVLTVESSSVGSTYTCSVGYKVGTSIPDQKVITPTVVTNFPAGLAGTCVNSGSSLKCNCSVTDLGLPTAVLKIKVNNHTIMNTTQNFLEEVVTDTSVQCCMEGDGVKCINEDGAKEACLSVTVPGTTATSSPPAPTTSTTASATTVTSTIPISKTTTSSTTTTMTTLPNATNPATTTATAPKVSTSTTGSTSIRTATQEISTSTTTRSSITTTMAANSDKGVIIMIIVVSVIGGILVIAIIFMLFLLGHWKNGFVQIGHKKHALNSSHRYVGHRIHQMKRKHKTTTGRSEHSTFQPYHKSGDYSFYRGVQNPVFDETLDKPISQDVYRHTPEMTHSLQYNECQPEHPYNKNWEEM